MEFPTLGNHCSFETCHQLDFLPFKCDACEKTFCLDHMSYQNHNCSSANKRDVQVPVCPLCNQPIPVARGELPDIRVSQHIDNDCAKPKTTGQIYTNRCSVKKCKQRELTPITCPTCKLNYCLKHRHPTDHDCMSPKPWVANTPRNPVTHKPKVNAPVASNLEDDYALAKAIQESEAEYAAQQRSRSAQRSGNRDCILS